MPIFTYFRWHDELSFIKQAYVYDSSESCGPSNFAAKRRYLRRLAPLVRPPQPPKINFNKHSAVGEQQAQNRKCSPQDCAGRSLPTAEARSSLYVRICPPQAAAREQKTFGPPYPTEGRGPDKNKRDRAMRDPRLKKLTLSLFFATKQLPKITVDVVQVCLFANNFAHQEPIVVRD